MLQKFAATLAAIVFAGASYAATETFSFLGYHAGETDVYEASKEFTGSLGGTVEVTMGTFGHSIAHTGSDGGGFVGQWDGWGLGVCSRLRRSHCRESHTVDGWGTNEYLRFSLEQDAVLESITFLNYGNGTYDLSTMSGDEYWSAYHGMDVSGTDVGSMFFVGAWDHAAFKVQSITVSYADVPLPAAGFLLLGGLGGLAALKRRKR